jgi:hypothetical protein
MNARQAAKTIYQTEGVKGFTRGLAPSLIKNSLMTGQFFSILFYFEQLLSRLNVLSDRQIQFLAGCSTKSMQSVLVNPITVVKTRLEVIGFNEYSGILDACSKIYRNEGLKGFFTGLRISLIRDVPFSGTFYPIYSFFRSNMSEALKLDDGHLTQAERTKRLAIVSTISSFSANVVSCTLTHPLDLIRTREICKFYNHDKT